MKIEHERELLAARAEAEHRERMAAVAAEIEATRRYLANMDEMPTKIEKPGRRLLEWMVPAAATVLVGFLGVMVIGGEDVAAKPALSSQTVELQSDSNVEIAPQPKLTPEPILVAETPEPAPEPVAVSKPVKPKRPKNPKNTDPLIITNPGDPLG